MGTLGLGLQDADEPTGLAGATFGIRMLARVIDLAVHYVIATAAGVTGVVLVLLACALAQIPSHAPLTRMTVTGMTGYVGALLGSAWMHACCEGLHGSTLGKRILGLTVVTEAGEPSSFLAGVKRTAYFYIDALVFGLVAYQKMKDTREQQRHGDEAAGTLVVRIKDLPPGSRRSWRRFAGVLLLACAGDFLILFVEVLSRVARG
jgi:uncharacterized RDD family membrane protein YckC